MIEYTITIKDENLKISHKDISYDPILLSLQSDQIQQLTIPILERFKKESNSNEIPEIEVKFRLKLN